jgi:hypothetical protein
MSFGTSGISLIFQKALLVAHKLNFGGKPKCLVAEAKFWMHTATILNFEPGALGFHCFPRVILQFRSEPRFEPGASCSVVW